MQALTQSKPQNAVRLPNRIVFSRPQWSVLTRPSSRTLFMAGQRGGKTAIIGPLAYSLISNIPNAVGFIGANTYMQLSDSTLKEIFAMWAKIGVNEYTTGNPFGMYVIGKKPPLHFKPHGHTFLNNHNKIYFQNGAVIMIGSLENYNSLEGRTLGWAMLDETADTREDALRTVITARLSQSGIYVNPNWHNDNIPYLSTGIEAVNPLYVFTKPGRVEWLNNYFGLNKYEEEIKAKIFNPSSYYDSYENGRHVVLCSVHHNVRNLPHNYISERIKDLTPDEAERLIYGSPFSKQGNEYYSSFSTSNIKEVEYLPNYPLHISFDFNVNPYMTLTVWQIREMRNGNYEARAIAEYALKTPRNTIEDVCRTFLDDWDHLCYAGLYVYGDSSGKSKLPLKDAKSYFSIVRKELNMVMTNTSLRLLKQNPRHNGYGVGTIGRREFMNGMLRGRYGVEVSINPRCKLLISDFQNIKEDPNGAKHKTKELIEGVSCEKYGHMSDSADAFLCYNWGKYLKDKNKQ